MIIKPKEDIMTNFNSTLIATAFVALGALSVSSLTAKADITGNLMRCQAYNAEKVIRCCDQVIQTEGRPFWMIENNVSCQSAVSCVGGGRPSRDVAAARIAYNPKKHCAISIKFNDSQGTPGRTGKPRGQSPIAVLR
jgi:hypothetical protein